MKYCQHCSSVLQDDAKFCNTCGYPCNNKEQIYNKFVGRDLDGKRLHDTTMITITKVFLIIGCILNGLEIIPLLWCIPMTIHYFTYVRDYNPLSITFKICC